MIPSDSQGSARTIQNAKNRLKYKAPAVGGTLRIEHEGKSYVMPVSVNMIAADDLVFLSFRAVTDIFRRDAKGGLQLIPRDSSAEGVLDKLDPGAETIKRPRRRSELSPEMKALLSSIPDGHRIGYNADGSPKLIRTRSRRKKD